MKDPNNDYVCADCGIPFLTEKDKNNPSYCYSTFHQSECCLCRETKGVTHIRNFNRLRNDTKIPQRENIKK